MGLFSRTAVSAFALPAFALVAVALASPPAAASPYTSLVVFGDSLSDNGNAALVVGTAPQVITGNTYIPNHPYASGTFSNGAIWASNVAASLGVMLGPSLAGGTDYAFGGATTGGPSPPPNLLLQASLYLATHVASPTALYVIEGGGNDARAALLAIAALPPGTNPGPTIAATAAAYAANVGAIVDQLQLAGAQHIVVWDTPNLGLAPAVAAGGPPVASLATFIASSMNFALASRLFGEVGVSTFDIFGLGTSFAQNPGAFGFTDATNACGAIALADCNTYAFWDGIHPTAAAHLVIADAFLSVASVPEPSTWAMLLIGFAGMGFVAARRRQSALS
jgi:outer membrane lipase/esterase